ncbi:hypothetical protein VW35_08190 [Devosia soli]|uniref:Regulator of SigK n=1 Tax=Devosia soli TaxID=361041 RepID=A0A0F5LFJ0_9HYPH|nr:anti-sigma factor [Devosia soli]KKB80357.1 hypothetical protein VW35_08190 [Devosia soli]
MTSDQLEQAGQYVLGLLGDDERRIFEAEIASDTELAKAVNKLRDHFHRLDDTAAALPPNPELWNKIEARLGSSPIDLAALRNRPTASPSRAWLPFAAAASIVVALGVGYMVGSTLGTTRQPEMIAVLVNEADATPGAIIEAFADDSVRVISLDNFVIPPGQVLEVWTLPDADTGPVSLGTFTDASTLRLTGPDLPAPHVGQLYEITVEPSPGSPTGRPTGPILVKGFAKQPV